MNAVRQKLIASGLLLPTAETPQRREHSNAAAIITRKQEDPKVRRAVEILNDAAKRGSRKC